MLKDPRLRDIHAQAAAAAFSDAFPGDKKTARTLQRSRRTATRYRHEGTPAMRAMLDELLLSEDPWRLLSYLRFAAKHIEVRKLTRPQLIARVRELLVWEAQTEGVDNTWEREADHNWVQRAALKEQDSSINAELAACYWELERRGVKREEVIV